MTTPDRHRTTALPIDVRHPSLPALFDPAVPNAPMIFAVLDGRAPGRALADDPARPTTAIVQTRGGLAAPSRDADRAFLDESLSTLRADSAVGLVWREDGGPMPTEAPAKRAGRLDFAPLDTSSPALAELRASLRSEVAVRPLTRALLERCQWGEEIAQALGGSAGFLENGLGLCLLDGEEIVAEAYAPYIGRGSAEVGVVTAEGHRGRGYAAYAAAHLAASLAQRDLTMYWSCDADNGASVKVARKLGFGPPRRFELLLYR